ncbi:MAG: DUF6266 family protein [Bacteroidota bacterium]
MATYNKGILGGFSGKTGSVVGTSWKGRAVMRSLPSKRSKTVTQAQLDQQEKFKLAISFLSGMADLLSISFGSLAGSISGYNAAVSYNIQKAVLGSVSPFSIDFSLTQVSLGVLPGASNPAALAVAGNQVRFNWADNSGTGKALATDIAVLVAFCPETQRSVYTTAGALRSGLTQTLDTSVYAGKTVETWLAFMSADGKKCSDSVYTGQLTLVP